MRGRARPAVQAVGECADRARGTEAYSSYIFGSFLQEQEGDWGDALAKFVPGRRKALETLARVWVVRIGADVCKNVSKSSSRRSRCCSPWRA